MEFRYSAIIIDNVEISTHRSGTRVPPLHCDVLGARINWPVRGGLVNGEVADLF